MSGYTKELSDKIRNEISKAVINQDQLTNLGLTAVLIGGHVLIEGLPGLAKTLWARSFSKTISADFKRVQFTADLMPSDILGTKVYDMQKSEFYLKKGPLFTNLFLADEINRTPPKTQSALLEVMEEKTITIDGETHDIRPLFSVFATQNPLELEGTYPLPEALLDRFSMKLSVTYPGLAAEKKLLNMYNENAFVDLLEDVSPVCTADEFVECGKEISEVKVDESIINYILSIIETTRRVTSLSIGASPRGSVVLLQASKAYAALNGRDYVIPDDIKELAVPVLRHRIILKPESELDGLNTSQVIENILTQVKVPR